MLPPNCHLRSRFHVLYVTVAILTMGGGTKISLIAQTAAQDSSANCDQNASPAEFQKLQTVLPQSSLVHYCLAESLLRQHDYQASANEFRDALRRGRRSRLDQGLELHRTRQDF